MLHLRRLVELTSLAIEQPFTIGVPQTDGGYFTVLDAVDALNEAQDHIAQIMAEARAEGYFATDVDLSISSGVPYIDLPPGVTSVHAVQVISAGGKPFARRGVYRDGVVTAPFDPGWVDAGFYTTGSDFLYAVWGDRLWISPQPPQSIAGAVKLFYIQALEDMLMGKATGGSTSTINLPSTQASDLGQSSAEPVASAYVGYELELLSGTGSGQRRKITAYTAGRVATVSPDWTTAPDVTSEFAFFPRMPKAMHRMLPIYAAVALRMDKDEAWQHLDSRFSKRLGVAISAIEGREMEYASVQAYGEA